MKIPTHLNVLLVCNKLYPVYIYYMPFFSFLWLPFVIKSNNHNLTRFPVSYNDGIIYNGISRLTMQYYIVTFIHLYIFRFFITVFFVFSPDATGSIPTASTRNSTFFILQLSNNYHQYIMSFVTLLFSFIFSFVTLSITID